MTARLSFGRTLAVAGIVTAVAVPLSAGAAFADTKPHHPQPPAHSVGHPQPPAHGVGHPMPGTHHDTVTTLRTRVRDAHIRSLPNGDRHTRALDTLRRPGSRVAVTCWTNGARVNGSNVWYKTVAPSRGYISSSEVARPAHPVGRCH
jgi:hypothetical protein